jgi:hypothetical protein
MPLHVSGPFVAHRQLTVSRPCPPTVNLAVKQLPSATLYTGFLMMGHM